MAGVYDKCARCGASMVHASGRGKARKYCGVECQRQADTDRNAAKVRPHCSVDGCCAQANRVKSGLCEAHYMRVRRHGDTDKLSPAIPGALEHSGGYVLAAAPGHPRSLGGYRAYEHRVVFTDAHGEGPFNCHWCKKLVAWHDMHVDHVDDDRTNNLPANLVASCPVCNQKRGEWKMLKTIRERHGLEVNGRKLTLNEWAAATGLTRTCISWRLQNGWAPERAVTEPRGVTGPKRTRGPDRAAERAQQRASNILGVAANEALRAI